MTQRDSSAELYRRVINKGERVFYIVTSKVMAVIVINPPFDSTSVGVEG